MIKTNKNGFLKAAGLMLALTMLAACVVSGTLAKYTSSRELSGASVTAAKWSINVGSGANKDIASENFDLGTLTWTIEAISAEADNTAFAPEKIAPGTWGYAAITVENASEVDALIKATGVDSPSVTKNSAGLSFKGIARKGAATTLDSFDAAVSDIDGDLDSGVTLAYDGDEKTFTIYLCYEWKYDDGASGANDANDVKDAGQSFEFGSITLTATQVEPKKD